MIKPLCIITISTISFNFLHFAALRWARCRGYDAKYNLQIDFALTMLSPTLPTYLFAEVY
jgi:hypothetical protein